jgi:hypothetical protein
LETLILRKPTKTSPLRYTWMMVAGALPIIPLAVAREKKKKESDGRGPNFDRPTPTRCKEKQCRKK